jgi:hypothetical protein
MKYLTLVLALASVPACAFATGAAQKSEVLDGQSSATATQPSAPHHEPLIKIRYVLLPPAISAHSSADDEVAKGTSRKRDAAFSTMTLRLDGGTTNRVNTEISQIMGCAPLSRVSC